MIAESIQGAETFFITPFSRQLDCTGLHFLPAEPYVLARWLVRATTIAGRIRTGMRVLIGWRARGGRECAWLSGRAT